MDRMVYNVNRPYGLLHIFDPKQGNEERKMNMNIELSLDEFTVLNTCLNSAVEQKRILLNEEREYMKSCCEPLSNNAKNAVARIAELEGELSELRSLSKKINQGEKNTRTVNDYVTHNLGMDVEIIIESKVPGTCMSERYYKGLIDAVPDKLLNVAVLGRSWSVLNEMWVLEVFYDPSLLEVQG